MPNTLNSNIVLAPGTYVFQTEAGFLPVELAPFNATYLLGTSASGDFNAPTQVISAEDFTNQFGSSSSLSPLKLYFANNPNGVLFFVNCKHPQVHEVTLGSPGEGTYSLNIAGTVVSINYVDGSPTGPEAVVQMVNAINANNAVNGTVFAYDASIGDNKFRIRGQSADTATFTLTSPTAPSGSTMTVSADLAANVSHLDAVWACENAFDDEMVQGFLCAPEFFASLTTQSDRTSVATAMENLASREGFDWMAFIDSGPFETIDTHAKAVTEGQLYTSAKGHCAYFFPYLVDLEDAVVPPSTAIAGLAIRRYRTEGFQEPPAGAKFPVKGVKDVKYKVTKAHQEIGNPLGINAIRNLPNKGIVAWGSRTRSSSPYYRFVNTRVIINILAGTLKHAFDTLIFSAVDGQGVLFTRIAETINQICYRMWIGGALYGARVTDAFAVECSTRNNPAIDLEAGIVRADVWIVPVPTMERLFVNVIRTPIGQVQAVVADALANA